MSVLLMMKELLPCTTQSVLATMRLSVSWSSLAVMLILQTAMAGKEIDCYTDDYQQSITDDYQQSITDDYQQSVTDDYQQSVT